MIAPHQGRIYSHLWLTIQHKLSQNTTFQNGRKCHNTWLAGKIKCGRCGYALASLNARNGVTYLRCKQRADNKSCQGAGNFRVPGGRNSGGIVRPEFFENYAFFLRRRNLEGLSAQRKLCPHSIFVLCFGADGLLWNLLAAVRHPGEGLLLRASGRQRSRHRVDHQKPAQQQRREARFLWKTLT